MNKVLDNEISEKNNRRGLYKVSIAFACILFICSVILFEPMKGVSNKDKVVQQKSNDFYISVFAATGDKSTGNLIIENKSLKLLDQNKNTIIPMGKIKINKQVIDFDGEGGFLVEGENIEEVQYISENGSFLYINRKRGKEIDDKSIRLHLPMDNFPENLDHEESMTILSEMSKRGEIKEFENKNLAGKPIVDIIKSEDYSIGVTNLEKEGYITFRIRNTKDMEGIVKYDNVIEDRECQGVLYSPVKAVDILLLNNQVKFEDLPKDNIKVIVKFKNGDTITKNIETSFDNEGNICAIVK